jgi:arginase family enzyme
MAKRRVTLIGVPLDLGAGRRGVNMGPSAFRVAEVDAKIAELGYNVNDRGDLRVKIQETQGPGDPRLKYLKEIVEVCEALRDRVGEALEAGRTPPCSASGRPRSSISPGSRRWSTAHEPPSWASATSTRRNGGM